MIQKLFTSSIQILLFITISNAMKNDSHKWFKTVYFINEYYSLLRFQMLRKIIHYSNNIFKTSKQVIPSDDISYNVWIIIYKFTAGSCYLVQNIVFLDLMKCLTHVHVLCLSQSQGLDSSRLQSMSSLCMLWFNMSQSGWHVVEAGVVVSHHCLNFILNLRGQVIP